jgi:hypothetical protein
MRRAAKADKPIKTRRQLEAETGPKWLKRLRERWAERGKNRRGPSRHIPPKTYSSKFSK